MNTYLIQFQLTGQGLQRIKESPSRVEAAKKTVHNLGGEVRAFYGILGSEFDTLFIVNAPNDEIVARMALSISALGNVRTTTHRLFNEDEYRKITGSI